MSRPGADATLVVGTVDRLDWPTPSERRAWASLPRSGATHAELLARIPQLRRIEARLPREPLPEADRTLRVAFWNVERLRHVEAVADLLAAKRVDVALLAEVDLGMARSGNRHTVADLAGRTGAGWAFGVEYVELGPGNARERPLVGDAENLGGLHGNAIVTRHLLRRLAMLRLEERGDWFDGSRGEPRIGGRMALFAQVELAGAPLTLVCTHFESHTDPADRAEQMRVLLDAVETYDPAAPVLIGGDVNTSTFALAERRDPGIVAAALAADPLRLLEPERHEPLFTVAAARGYDWRSCNLPGASTQRPYPEEAPRPLGRIDWFFARGLVCRDPAVIPALNADGAVISDHEAILVTVRPARRR